MSSKTAKMRQTFDSFTNWENWPLCIKYILLSPIWIWLCIKSRSVWFFTSSNPTITFGGFEGEAKKEMYRQLPMTSYPATLYISCNESFKELNRKLNTGLFTFPLAAKPDVGMSGLMFRKISSIEDLRKYHAAMKVDYILQAYIDYPIEISVFYVRYPGEKNGKVTGVVKKEGLSIKGDGVHNLLQLIQKDPRTRKRLQELKCKHRDDLEKVIPAGFTFPLSDALNLSRGGKLVTLEHEIDERLTGAFDKIADYAGHFYYGRYDVKCLSLEDLKNFKNFCILEFNGAGADPHHVYGGNKTFLEALRVILMHWKVLYEISAINRKAGVRRWTFIKGVKHMWWSHWHFKRLTKLDAEFNLRNERKAPARESQEIELVANRNGARLAS
jgi:hypothetical protein